MTRTTPDPPDLIVSDVDGTLIDDRNIVRPLTVRSVAAASQRGVPLVLATGRPPRWIHEITSQLPASSFAVCANGAIVYDIAADRVLHSATLEPDVLRKIAALAHEHLPGAGLAAERVGRSAHDSATAPFVATSGYQHAWLNPDHLEVGDDEILEQSAVKLLVRHTGMTSDAMMTTLSAAMVAAGMDELAAITYSTNNGLIEVARPGVNKASGLSTLAEMVGLGTERVIAFGDMPNDIEMLRWARHGVAVLNAHDATKAAADEVGAYDNNHDAVGQVLERWFD